VTPDEAIATAYQELRASLVQELLEKIRQSSPQFFEQLVVDVLLAMGYGGSQRDAGEALGKSGDGGIDGVIRKTNWVWMSFISRLNAGKGM
jgi:restriction system protein